MLSSQFSHREEAQRAWNAGLQTHRQRRWPKTPAGIFLEPTDAGQGPQHPIQGWRVRCREHGQFSNGFRPIFHEIRKTQFGGDICCARRPKPCKDLEYGHGGRHRCNFSGHGKSSCLRSDAFGDSSGTLPARITCSNPIFLLIGAEKGIAVLIGSPTMVFSLCCPTAGR